MCDYYFLKVETITSPKRKARIKADAHKEINPIKMNPLFDISSPILISNKERMKQIVVSKAILMFVFFIVFLCLNRMQTSLEYLDKIHIIEIFLSILGIPKVKS